MPDVFICHSSTDQWRADRVCYSLEQEGMTCWIAPRDVPRQYPHAWGEGALMNEVLGQVRVFLVLLSEDAATSPRITREVKAAVRHKKTCLTVGFGPSAVALGGGLPLDHSRTRQVELSSPVVGGGYEELTEAVRAALEMEQPEGPDTGPGPRFAFVSYKREDFARVEPHLRTLDRINCPFWYDTGIPGGAEWAATIEAQIRSCGFLLVFLSREAVASKHVRREVKFADKLDKRIVPVLLEPAELDGGLDMLLSQYQMLDSRDHDFEAHLQAAVRQGLPSASKSPADLLARSAPTGTSSTPQNSGAPGNPALLTDPETRLLQYIQGKPDVAWTLDVLSHLLDSRPDIAEPGPALVQTVHSLVEKGFLRADPAGGLTVTPRAVGYFRLLLER